MSTVFISNYFNHHQKPFCDEMYKLTGGNFVFIATSTMREERKLLGYTMDSIPSYVKCSYVDEMAKKECMDLAVSADVVIWGSAPYEYIKPRLDVGRLTIAYSERIYKTGCPVWKMPIRTVNYFRKYGRYRHLYMLCASAYTALDYSKTGTYRGKTYKWGYFPEVQSYNIEQLMASKEEHSLLWVGRLIDWKHPELPLQVACRLKENGYDFRLDMIGTGAQEHLIRNMITEFQLQDQVRLLGPMKPQQVREHMERAEIFLFTSDRNEGWGAVLNESMNSGCAVVAGHEIGSVPYLLDHGKNGLIFENGNFESLYNSIKRLLDDRELCNTLGKSAYCSINELWNAKTAAERLIVLSDELNKNKKCDLFETGPCSRAQIVKDNWFIK